MNSLERNWAQEREQHESSNEKEKQKEEYETYDEPGDLFLVYSILTKNLSFHKAKNNWH